MPRAYLFKNESKAEPGRPITEEELHSILRNRFPWGRGQRRIRQLRTDPKLDELRVIEDWGPWKPRGEFLRSLEGRLRNAKAGDVFQTENKRGGRKRIRIIPLPEDLDGDRVLAAIRGVWGAPYVFGGENPPGDVGGPGAYFDCSGLIDWAHNTLGIDLPHGSELIRQDPRVQLFQSERLCKPGDLVIMHFGRLAPGVADHIGAWSRPGVMLDTRSKYDPVGSSPIEDWAVMSFGRIEAVNGKL